MFRYNNNTTKTKQSSNARANPSVINQFYERILPHYGRLDRRNAINIPTFIHTRTRDKISLFNQKIRMGVVNFNTSKP